MIESFHAKRNYVCITFHNLPFHVRKDPSAGLKFFSHEFSNFLEFI